MRENWPRPVSKVAYTPAEHRVGDSAGLYRHRRAVPDPRESDTPSEIASTNQHPISKVLHVEHTRIHAWYPYACMLATNPRRIEGWRI